MSDEAAERDARDSRHRAEDHYNEEDLRAVKRGHQLSEIHQNAKAVLADGGGHRSEYSEGSEQHHVIGVAEHHLRERFAKLDHGTRFLADGRASRSEDEREDDDLEHFAARHRVDNADGKRMLEDLGEACGGGLLESGLGALLERHS